MKKIALLSDTHGYLDEAILGYCRNSDEIWHAGDFGTPGVSDILQAIKPLKGVHGNIDGNEIRLIHPDYQWFTCEGVTVYMIHIGGYPGHYSPGIIEKLKLHSPMLFITGHSHILKVMRDPKRNNMLHINPGAAGKYGFHQVRTMVTFWLNEGRIFNLEVIELGNKLAKPTASGGKE